MIESEFPAHSRHILGMRDEPPKFDINALVGEIKIGWYGYGAQFEVRFIR